MPGPWFFLVVLGSAWFSAALILVLFGSLWFSLVLLCSPSLFCLVLPGASWFSLVLLGCSFGFPCFSSVLLGLVLLGSLPWFSVALLRSDEGEAIIISGAWRINEKQNEHSRTKQNQRDSMRDPKKTLKNLACRPGEPDQSRAEQTRPEQT